MSLVSSEASFKNLEITPSIDYLAFLGKHQNVGFRRFGQYTRGAQFLWVRAQGHEFVFVLTKFYFAMFSFPPLRRIAGSGSYCKKKTKNNRDPDLARQWKRGLFLAVGLRESDKGPPESASIYLYIYMSRFPEMERLID